MSQEPNIQLCRICKEYSTIFNPIIQPCFCKPIHEACLIKQLKASKEIPMNTDSQGIYTIECENCSSMIYYHKEFKKCLVKFWSNAEIFRGFCFWLWLLTFQIIFFLLNYLQKDIKILIFDFIFSPLLLTIIIFDLTFKFHKGEKFMPCFLIGELVLTFTFFFLKMIVFAQSQGEKIYCEMAFRIPLILLLLIIIDQKMKAIFLLASLNTRKNSFFQQENLQIYEEVKKNDKDFCYCSNQMFLEKEIIEVIREKPHLINKTQIGNCYFVCCPFCKQDIYFYQGFAKKVNLSSSQEKSCEKIWIIVLYLIVLAMISGFEQTNSLFTLLIGWMGGPLIIGIIKFSFYPRNATFCRGETMEI